MTNLKTAIIYSSIIGSIVNELGGGEWLMNIRFITSSKDAVSKIKNIIKNAITEKYLTPSDNAIAHNVRKLLK